ncbi:MAG: hypothetical protein M1404_04400 [Acidobacteria bacterium]|nr:hypothetical protein [Acidobacteriota bacterium]
MSLQIDVISRHKLMERIEEIITGTACQGDIVGDGTCGEKSRALDLCLKGDGKRLGRAGLRLPGHGWNHAEKKENSNQA